MPYRAFPEPRSKWSFNDEPIRSDSRIKTETIKNNNSILLITKTTREDSGRYVLALENECGRDKCIINVIVLDKPSPPRDPKVTDISDSLIFKLILLKVFKLKFISVDSMTFK